MKFKMFSVFDLAAGVFLQPFLARSDADAKRNITAGFDDPQFLQSPAGRYPSEFKLFSLATFDDDTGILEAYTPSFVATLSDLRPLPPSSTVSS